MTTATDSARIAELRQQVADAERNAAFALGTHMHATYIAQRGQAMRELRQMGVTA